MSRCVSFVRAASVTLVLLTIYLVTMPPTLTWAHYGADGGDLVTAVAKGRLPHPPGFPVYLLLGAMFVRLPWGDPAWRLNLMSAVLGAGVAGLATATADRAPAYGDRRTTAGVVAPVAGLTLGLAPLLWSQALIAEVYAPAAFCSAGLLLLTFHQTPVWLLGGLWGLSLGVHPTLLWLGPLLVWGCGGSLRQGLAAGLAAVAGWGLAYGALLPLWGRSASPWSDLSGLVEWWAYVSARLYRTYVFALPLAYWPRRLLAYGGLMARQFTPVGSLLALWGWWLLWRERRSLAIATALAFGLFSLYAIGYNTTDSMVYLVPAMPVAALWMGRGVAEAAKWLGARRRWAGLLLLLLPLVLAAGGWREMDLRGDDSAVRWARQTLQAAPPRAVLLTAQDAATFTFWYARDVLGVRPDVEVVDQDLWSHEPYRRFFAEELKMARPPGSLREALDRLDRPVVVVRAPLEGGP